jgi:L-rhamnose mutarotase
LKVFDLDLFDSHYYIKRSTIIDKIVFDNRTFYAKFERIDEPLTPLLLQQHQDRQYTIAVPLLKDNHTNYLVLEYKGEEHERFYHLVKYLFKTRSITDYNIYEGKDKQRLQVFIKVDKLSLQEATTTLNVLSNALNLKMVKKWKCLPSTSVPNAYNIFTLPYKKI